MTQMSNMSPMSPLSSSGQRTIEHGGIETSGLNMTPMGHMTHHYSVCLSMTHMTHTALLNT